MKVLVTAARGQLGQALAATAPANIDAYFFTRSELDIADRAAVADAVTHCKPDWVVNAAAFTNVDGAESSADEAFRANRDGPAVLAEVIADVGARMLHVSTDYVFDGQSSTPYQESAPTNPSSIYGQSKLAGELALKERLDDRALIVRTSWVYSDQGNNFVNTMLRLMAERPELNVVSDQIGTPTSAYSLAGAIWGLVRAETSGVLHYTDAGVASWYDFAVAIAEEATTAGLLDSSVKISAINSAEYPQIAPRPQYSVLDKSRVRGLSVVPALVHWRSALREVLARMKRSA